MRQQNLNQRIGIEVKEEFRFFFSFYNRASLMPGPVRIGLCPIIKENQKEPLKPCRLKKEKSNFIN
jgi:hypothetical protein